jgi:hypothetical protein
MCRSPSSGAPPRERHPRVNDCAKGDLGAFGEDQYPPAFGALVAAHNRASTT